MKRLLKLAALALLSTLNSQLSTCLAQGSLTPPGAPAPTMKSLAQIEPRTDFLGALYYYQLRLVLPDRQPHYDQHRGRHRH